jgi:hypothetical protein
VCETFQTFTSIIKEETDLDDEDALNLAGALADHVLSAIVDRLQVSNPSLTMSKSSGLHTSAEAIAINVLDEWCDAAQRPAPNDGAAGAVTLAQCVAACPRQNFPLIGQPFEGGT